MLNKVQRMYNTEHGAVVGRRNDIRTEQSDTRVGDYWAHSLAKSNGTDNALRLVHPILCGG